MKLTLFLCLAALAFDGLEAGNTGRHKGGASMKTTYVGKLHETNAKGQEECVGTFSGSNTFEQPSECCWNSFAEKCKEFLGGLVNILSSSASCNPCGKGCTSIDLDMKSRITKPASKPVCESHAQPVVHVAPVYKQVVYQPQEHCGGDCESHQQPIVQPVVQQPVYKQVVYQPKEQCDECEQPHQQVVQPIVQPVVQQPVYQPVIEQVQVVPAKEGCDDCEEKKHKHQKHHKHHKHHHKHHKKEKCEDDCD